MTSRPIETPFVEQPENAPFAELISALEPKRTSIEEDWKQKAKTDAPDFLAFSILSPNELRISKAIAEILDPKGTHGQGSIFLKLFLESLNRPDFATTGRVTVRRECCTDSIERSNRRIDILIEGPNGAWAVAIENKPWTCEGENQLSDYVAHLANRYGNRFLLLRLAGYESNPTSLDFKTCKRLISEQKFCSWHYTGEFLRWLHRCFEQCQPDRVKMFIDEFRRYVALEFGNQPTNFRTFMNEKLVSALDQHFDRNPDGIKAYAQLADAMPALKRRWTTQLFNRVKQRLKSELDEGWKFGRENDDFADIAKHPKFFAEHESWNDRYRICLESQPCGRVILGIWHDRKWNLQPSQEIYTLLESLGWADEKDNKDWWNGYSPLPEPFTDWTAPEIIEYLNPSRKELEDLLVKGFSEIARRLERQLGAIANAE